MATHGNRTHHIPYVAATLGELLPSPTLEKLSKQLMALHGACILATLSGQPGAPRNFPATFEVIQAISDIGRVLVTLVIEQGPVEIYETSGPVLCRAWHHVRELALETYVFACLYNSLPNGRAVTRGDSDNAVVALRSMMVHLDYLGVDEGIVAEEDTTPCNSPAANTPSS